MVEIERKWLLKEDININDVIRDNCFYNIRDFYFNDFCRLRNQNDKWYLTIKSSGNIVREEYNFLLKYSQITFIPNVTLCKKRYNYYYKDFCFEVNVFDEVKYKDKPLVLIELELKSKDQEIELPDFIGEEVTDKNEFYGYNIFKKLSEEIACKK